MEATYQDILDYRKRIADLNGTAALLSWDQEVYMPQAGAAFRGDALASMAGIIHDLATSAKYGEMLESMSTQNLKDSNHKINVANCLYDFNKATKLPNHFVEAWSKATSKAYQNWVSAREAQDFNIFIPSLKEVVGLTKERASYLGSSTGIAYDALLNEYQPGLTTAFLDPLFSQLKDYIVNKLEEIKGKSNPASLFTKGPFDGDKQLALARIMLTDLDFDWNAGRLDLSVHPFSTNFSPEDARITTRVNVDNLQECIWGSLHECGHAFYEMGLPVETFGMPSSEAESLSIHESQSRLWENCVGKSLPYLEAYLPLWKEYFPHSFSDVDALSIYKDLNAVEPNLIRINSDELTYHLHVIIRYEIEKDLLSGVLEVEQLPQVWNEKIKNYLGLEVPNSTLGVLQDIHWSHGSFGYFPTYTLGTLYSVQFFDAAKKSIPTLMEDIKNKKFDPLLQWLRINIHRHGRNFTADELCKNATGSGLNLQSFQTYMDAKLKQVYDLA